MAGVVVTGGVTIPGEWGVSAQSAENSVLRESLRWARKAGEVPAE
jgi:hypothetical protein